MAEFVPTFRRSEFGIGEPVWLRHHPESSCYIVTASWISMFGPRIYRVIRESGHPDVTYDFLEEWLTDQPPAIAHKGVKGSVYLTKTGVTVKSIEGGKC